MAAKPKQRFATSGGEDVRQTLDLGALAAVPLAAAQSQPPAEPCPPAAKLSNKGRLEMRREKAGRGGKTVTTVSGAAWTLAPQRQREQLFAAIRKRCACGGKLTADGFELQGDHRESAAPALAAAGFTVVRAGG